MQSIEPALVLLATAPGTMRPRMEAVVRGPKVCINALDFTVMGWSCPHEAHCSWVLGLGLLEFAQCQMLLFFFLGFRFPFLPMFGSLHELPDRCDAIKMLTFGFGN